jgi:hypothetical protein
MPHPRTEREAKQEQGHRISEGLPDGKKRPFDKISYPHQINKGNDIKKNRLCRKKNFLPFTRSICSSETFLMTPFPDSE